MGAVYFNGNSSSNSVFYRIKPIPILNQTMGLLGNFGYTIPLVRAGQDRQFRINSSTSIVLISSSGTVTATISAGGVISGGFFAKVYLDSTDQCLYVIVSNGTATQYQLIKIDDTSGAVTNLGTTVAPASPSDWGFGTSIITEFGFMDKPTVSTLRIINNGYIHIINKADGTIVSEGTELILGGYSPRGCFYVNADGDIGANFNLGEVSDYDGMSLPKTVSASSGVTTSPKVAPYSVFTTKAESLTRGMIAVDDDKLAFVTLDAGIQPPCKLIYRADWDRFLRSVVDYHAGLI